MQYQTRPHSGETRRRQLCWDRCYSSRPRKTSAIATSSFTATSPTLLQQVAAKEPAAWDRLVQLYGPLVFHWARKQGLTEHDAADILQDVFASVARSIHTFESRQVGSFRSWLWTITRNQLVTTFRTRAHDAKAVGGTAAWEQLANVAESLSDDPRDNTDRSALNSLHRRGLDLVRSEFEERTWNIFWQVAVNERPTSDVAQEFGITANSVRQTKSRVLRRLRQVLGNDV